MPDSDLLLMAEGMVVVAVVVVVEVVLWMLFVSVCRREDVSLLSETNRLKTPTDPTPPSEIHKC